MKWRESWCQASLAILLIGFEPHGIKAIPQWTPNRKLELRESTRKLWQHGFDSYMRYAFPMDELRPLSCSGLGPDWDDPKNIGVNDVAGNYSLTLVDTLDTFIVLNDQWSRTQFSHAVRNVIEYVSFDVDTKPQVFETTIRALGGLLSGHIFASDPKYGFQLDWYNGELLNLAKDLGERLLPAFNTPTGIPWARINLRHGVPRGEITQTCTAGAGSLILEFGTLSRLTGDPRYEQAALKAFFALWNRRSPLGLVGNTIDIMTGKWLSPEVTGVGAGLDSFFEYALKWYILSGEVEFLDVWNISYEALMNHSRGSEGFWYRTVTTNNGHVATSSVDSLSAFWAGLQVLGGDVENAIKSHLIYWNLWRKYHGIPEIFDTVTRSPNAGGYPIRPEFIESTYFLYRATHDTFYLDVGEQILADLTARARVECGIATLADVTKEERDDRMESFVLSETLKYLFLLFDEGNPINSNDSNFVFSTEGHFLTLPSTLLNRSATPRPESHNHLQCLRVEPFRQHFSGYDSFLAQGIRSRTDAEYARYLVGQSINSAAASMDQPWWSTEGVCEVPKVDLYSFEFILSPDSSVVPEDTNPGRHKLDVYKDGYIVHDITGIRAHVTGRSDGRGYDITKLASIPILAGQKVYFNDSTIFGPKVHTRPNSILLRFKLIEQNPGYSWSVPGTMKEIELIAYTASFGGDPSGLSDPTRSLRFSIHSPPVQVFQVENNSFGCSPYSGSVPPNSVVLVERGNCTFLEKLKNAESAGAAGAVVWNPEGDGGLNAGLLQEEKEYAQKHLKDVALVVIGDTGAQHVRRMLQWSEENHDGNLGVQMSVFLRETAGTESTAGRVLYVNGLALLNTVLLF